MTDIVTAQALEAEEAKLEAIQKEFDDLDAQLKEFDDLDAQLVAEFGEISSNFGYNFANDHYQLQQVRVDAARTLIHRSERLLEVEKSRLSSIRQRIDDRTTVRGLLRRLEESLSEVSTTVLGTVSNEEFHALERVLGRPLSPG